MQFNLVEKDGILEGLMYYEVLKVLENIKLHFFPKLLLLHANLVSRSVPFKHFVVLFRKYMRHQKQKILNSDHLLLIFFFFVSVSIYFWICNSQR